MKLPEFEKMWEYENGFYLTCDINRISKILAHWELIKRAWNSQGEIVECGVFKGASVARFAAFRQILGNPFYKKIVGFDTFGDYPETNFANDKALRENIVQVAGLESISTKQLMKVLNHKKCDQNIELITGDICKTVPEYIKKNPQLKISLLNLDTDIYEPAVTILECLYPHIVKGGILILDDYGTWPGETKAVDEYFKKEKIDVVIKKFHFSMSPCYVVV